MEWLSVGLAWPLVARPWESEGVALPLLSGGARWRLARWPWPLAERQSLTR